MWRAASCLWNGHEAPWKLSVMHAPHRERADRVRDEVERDEDRVLTGIGKELVEDRVRHDLHEPGARTIVNTAVRPVGMRPPDGTALCGLSDPANLLM